MCDNRKIALDNPRFIYPLLAAIFVAILGFMFAQPRDPFPKYPSDIPRSSHRTDPVPPWTVSSWNEEVDLPYREIRQSIEREEKQTPGIDHDQIWVGKAAVAFHDWHNDYRNPIKLYEASLTILTARRHGKDLGKNPEFEKARSQVNLGWSMLRNVPASYEYSRLGYIYNAGDFDFHKYGDLGERLIARDPVDRDVALAMIQDYVMRKPDPKFENLLFATLNACSKTKAWGPWDYQRQGFAYRIYGQRHKDIASYKKAIELSRLAIAKTRGGWDTSWIDIFISGTEIEMKDPKFGVIPGGRPIYELDP